jgi:ribonuclease E
MKRMLINATQPEERRLAMVDGQKLLNFEIEQEGREQRKGNIYKAVVTRIEPSLEACFVDYGEERHGFLPFKEISRQYFPEGSNVSQIKINEAIHVGQELIVQVEKEERGNKNAALTTFISLAGRYLVLMPNNPRGGGVSRRIEGDERQELKDNLDQLKYPRGMSLIARTAGIGRAVNELQWDLNYLLSLWKAIDGAAQSQSGAFLIYQESSLVIRAIRDYYTPDIGEILIDTDDIYSQANQFMAHIMPDDARKVKRYRDDTPLFARFQIENQIESAYARIVVLPSGGSIVLDHTEALVAIDVNSARATRGGDIEETATNTNLEAADEIARQLRLRDLGGLIVIDFIDMEEPKNRQEVENRLRNALKQDRARVQFSSISKFGLLELSRQRLRPALFEGASITCPRCNGTGHIRDTESSALQILRIIQEEAMKDNTAAVKVQVPVDVTSFLLNEKRMEITKIELKQRVSVILVPNKQFETPNYKLERLKYDDPQLEHLQASYTMAEETENPDMMISKAERKTNRQEPVIKNFLPDAPPPAMEEKPAEEEKLAAPASNGFFGWLKKLFGGQPTPVPEPEPEEPKKKGRSGRTAGSGNRRSGERSSTRRNDRGEGRKANGERSTERQTGEKQGDRRNSNRQTADKDNTQQRRNQRRQPETDKSILAGSEAEQSNGAENTRPPRENRRGKRRDPQRDDQAANAATDDVLESQDQAEKQSSEAGTGTAPVKRERRERRPRNQAQTPAVDTATSADHAPEQGLPESADQAAKEQGSDDAAANQNGYVNINSEQEAPRQRSRRTRDRYGRDRRQRGPREDGFSDSQNGHDSTFGAEIPETEPMVSITSDAAENTEQTAPAGSSTIYVGESVQSATVETQEQAGGNAEPNVVEKVTGTAMTVTVEHLPVTADSVVTQQALLKTAPPASEEHKPQSNAAAEQKNGAYTLPQSELNTVAQNAGLVWVNTDPQRAAAVQEAINNEPKQPHIPREPKPRVVVDEGPLVLVETKKDLSKMHMPFDQ